MKTCTVLGHSLFVCLFVSAEATAGNAGVLPLQADFAVFSKF